MEERMNAPDMLDLMIRPGFCVKNQTIVQVNTAARELFFSEGMPILPLLLTGSEEYTDFAGGCLYLSVSVQGQPRGASVIRMEPWDLFLLDPDTEEQELRSMALAAKELREPLSYAMHSVELLLSQQTDPDALAQMAKLNQGLYQMLRIIGNMSDAGRSMTASRQEILDLPALISEIFEKSTAMVTHSGLELTYTGLDMPIYCLADREQLERAILNILSNSLKFTPKGGHIHGSLTRKGRTLRLCIQDSGSGIAQAVRSNLFCRYLRQPTIEDSRYGIGLGMVLSRAAAANHGGTVLIDQPEGAGTRITLTLTIRQSSDCTLRCPMLRVDYAGERDHALVELAECLPPQLYDGTH